LLVGTLSGSFGKTNMDSALLDRLVASIQQGRLVLFCGAGLSVAPPSAVPGAVALTQQIIGEYNRRVLSPLPPAATANLEALSEYLFAGGHQSLFVRDLVEWRPFTRNPNSGHQAVADFLTSGAIQYGVTTNFDELVELASRDLGVDRFDAAFNSASANINHKHQTYLKIHGCVRDPDHTLWCHSQLNGPLPVSFANQTVRDRLDSSRAWLGANLPEKDLVFIGFWSDWSYLNDVLETCFNSVHGSLVVLVDPQDDTTLKAKAPALWTWANTSTEFRHLPEKGDDFLKELRSRFSRNLLERVLMSAATAFQDMKPGSTLPATSFSTVSLEDLYAFRRDTGGVSSIRIPRYTEPEDSMNAVGRAHLLLRHAGATLDGSRYVKGGHRFRVVNGKTKLISEIRQDFAEEPPAPLLDDVVICAGGTEDGGVPSHIVRGSTPPTVVRSGTSARWISLETAVAEGLC
jgi:hypothetical protein